MSDIRKLNPDDIALPSTYRIEVFATGLNAPINAEFTDTGEMLVADAGVTDGNGKVVRRTHDAFEVIADGFTPPLTGITFHKGNVYVAHRGRITMVSPSGQKEDILAGLPSSGDHHNNRVVFGPDGKMYFGQGTATNSGVVGEDNGWVKQHWFFHDIPGSRIRLFGHHFRSTNILTRSREDTYTGAYSPFGVETETGEAVRGMTPASGSILRANPDGSQLELVAWGLRNPFRLRFDHQHRLFACNHGMDERGSRHIANSPDEFQLIRAGAWYGWPDYSGGYPVTLPHFKPEGKPQPTFLLAGHPMQPPSPIANFTPHSATMGFDFNYDRAFAPVGDVFIAEFGSEAPGTTGGRPLPQVGHRVSCIDIKTGLISDFAVNRSGYAATYTGDGGLERPIDVLFGPTGEMFIVDMGILREGAGFVPSSGVIWRVTRQY